MQFVVGGPEIPNSLLQAHEEGRVVFFCGAGISYPAGLPDFRKLVEKVFADLRMDMTPREKSSCHKFHQYDTTLELLERRLAGGSPAGRHALREAVARVLRPNSKKADALATHKALLTLAQDSRNKLRLITTNFDRLFEMAGLAMELDLRTHIAPFLPVPKASRWDSLVYLHGLLPENPDPSALDQLVLTSGDFGRAYLTERWAARFAGELFRNFVVCFAGYSIGDPVLRYMMDALAADRRQGEKTLQAYAFGSYRSGQEEAEDEWRAKGVEPILYHAPTPQDHARFHKTLRKWAEIHGSGVEGRERLVMENAIAAPGKSTQEDDFVGRVMWALAHPSGLPAKRFAEVAHHFEWVQVFNEPRYLPEDLACFGNPEEAEGASGGKDPRFSFLSRPCSTHRGSFLSLLTREQEASWDLPLYYVATWLLRHLGNPELLMILSRQGGTLNSTLAGLIDRTLSEIVQRRRERKEEEVDRLLDEAPDAEPSPRLCVLWRLFIAGRFARNRRSDLYAWIKRLKRDGLTASARFELRELLSPRIRVEAGWAPPSASGEGEGVPVRVDPQVEVVPAASHVASVIRRNGVWKDVQVELAGEIQDLLRDALDLMRELAMAGDTTDMSSWDLPSIEDHPQNQGFAEWVVLIELLRDAWLALLAQEPERARRMAREWMDIPYPAFKRLALFAASRDEGIPAREWVSWLLAEAGFGLWDIQCRREAMRLLVLRGAGLSEEDRLTLEDAILAGRPLQEGDGEEGREDRGYEVWLRLAKLESAGADLGEGAAARLQEIASAHPSWKLHGFDEFSHWPIGNEDPEYDVYFPIEECPREPEALALWMEERTGKRKVNERDDFEGVCKDLHSVVMRAFEILSSRDKWPVDYWRRALNVWTWMEGFGDIWQEHAAFFSKVPDDVLEGADHAFAFMMKKVAEDLKGHEAEFFSLCLRILDQTPAEGDDPSDPVGDAINHPVGKVTEALVSYWFAGGPKDGDCLPEAIASIFTRLCDTDIPRFKHGRVILASQVVALFRVDQEWCERHLLPLFDWQKDRHEARAAWKGYLWSPRLHLPLQIAWKTSFLAVAEHCGELGKHGEQYAAVLAHATLARLDGFSEKEFKKAFGGLTKSGLARAAKVLAQIIESTGDSAEGYWKKHAFPFWLKIWPRHETEKSSGRTATALAEAAISAKGCFPDAVKAFEPWFVPLGFPANIVDKLENSGLCSRFPDASLTLLWRIIEKDPWNAGTLERCLGSIRKAKATLEKDYRYRKLHELLRRSE